MLCGLGGIISCGSTHTMVVPLDLVKCRIQVDPDKYKNIFHGFKVTMAEDGVKGLSKGWAPTFFGYSAQGLCKFGLYEVFKVLYADAIGEENAFLWRTSLYLASSASAEFFADIALSPFEAAKVKIQTTPGFANTLREAIPKMQAEEGVMAFYKVKKIIFHKKLRMFIFYYINFVKSSIGVSTIMDASNSLYNDEICML